MYPHFSSEFTSSLCPFLVVSIEVFLTDCVPCARAVSFILAFSKPGLGDWDERQSKY